MAIISNIHQHLICTEYDQKHWVGESYPSFSWNFNRILSYYIIYR